MQVDQLTKQLVEQQKDTLNANTKKKYKEHCNVVVIDKIIIVKGEKKENLDG